MASKSELGYTSVKIIKKEVEIEQDIHLNNGDLIVYEDKVAYVVSHENGASYCSLVDLRTGCFVCSEHCSRKTTRKRIAAHLRTWVGGSYKTGCDSISSQVKYNKLEIYKRSQYSIDLNISIEAKSVCSNAVYGCNVNDVVDVQPLEGEQCPHCGGIIKEDKF